MAPDKSTEEPSDPGSEMTEQTDDSKVCLRKLSDNKRRRLMQAMAGAGTAGLAGCLGFFELEDQRREPEDTRGGDDDDDDNGDDADPDSFAVEYLRQEESLDVSSDQELLYAGLDEDWDLPYQCEIGVCGVCEAEVDGDGTELVEMTANDVFSAEEVEDGKILTCTAQPRADFALDTHPAENGLIGDTDDAEDDGTFEVEYTQQGETLDVAEDEELLYAGLDEGWDLPYSCEVGVCGVCEAEVDGDGTELVEMTTNDVLSDDEVQDGRILTCTAQPRDNFAVDTDP